MKDQSSNGSLESILVSLMEACEQADRQPIDVDNWVLRYPEHANQIRSYLANRQQFEAVLGPRPASDPNANTLGMDRMAEPVGTHVRYFGDYELLGEIARGGMGVVYKARQSSLRRFLALKMILSGHLASESDVLRFRAEAEAAANLDHPNIVPIYEIGEHEGQQYFTMKLIEGGSLSQAKEEHRLQSTAERHRWIASLMCKVAQAVQHAHDRGILHRDLKPGNILIDRCGEPHVTDFGLAKKVTGDSELTNTGAILGTPAYMSPEQARGEKSLTTAADVYSLGAILYELLAGQVPFLGSTPLETILAVVDKEPTRPSAIMSSIDRDLETITLKCLQKKPESRYRSASELAADLQRWFEGVPIEARPVGQLERTGKWVRRNPVVAGLLIASLLMTVGVIAALTGLLYQAKLRGEESQRNLLAAQAATERETKLRTEAQAAKEQAETAAETERQARIAEEQERKYAQAISKFVIEDFLALTSVEGQERFGGEGLDRNTTLYQLLERAAEKLSMRTDLAPRIEAELSWIIGLNYRGAGEAEKGLPFLERSVELRSMLLGQDDPLTLDSLNSLAVCYHAAGQAADAIPLHEHVLEVRRAILGFAHASTLRTLNNLAGCYQELGQTEKAAELFQQSLELCQTHLGDQHAQTLDAMNDVAVHLLATNQPEKALMMFEDTLKLRRNVLGNENSATLASMNNLAATYWKTNQLEKSIPLFEELVQIQEKLSGRKNSTTQRMLANLGVNYKDDGEFDKSIPLLEEAMQASRRFPSLWWVREQLKDAYASAGRMSQFQTLAQEDLELGRVNLVPDSLELASLLLLTGHGYLKLGSHDQAIPLLQQGLEIRQQQAPDEWFTFSATSLLGEALLRQSIGIAEGSEKQQLEVEAERLLVSGLLGLKQHQSSIPGDAADRIPATARCLIELLTAQDRVEEAEAYRHLVSETR